MIVLIPINKYLLDVMLRHVNIEIDHRDKRGKFTQDLLAGMKVENEYLLRNMGPSKLRFYIIIFLPYKGFKNIRLGIQFPGESFRITFRRRRNFKERWYPARLAIIFIQLHTNFGKHELFHSIHTRFRYYLHVSYTLSMTLYRCHVPVLGLTITLVTML